MSKSAGFWLRLRRAAAELGSVDARVEEVRDNRLGAWFALLAQDLSYAWRILRKSPGFTIVAVEAGALPIRVFRGLRSQPGLDPNRNEQPVDIKRKHVGTIHVLRVLERAGKPANILSLAIPRPTGQARP